MAIGRHFHCYVKAHHNGKKSILLEQRNRKEFLLFEGGVSELLDADVGERLKKYYEKTVEAFTCLGVLKFDVNIESSCLFVFFVTGCASVGKIANADIYRITNCSFIPLQETCDLDSRIQDVQKLLVSGCFYFSVDELTSDLKFDISTSVQRQNIADIPDSRFFWNFSMYNYLQKFGIDADKWFVRIMCGGVEIRTVYVGARQAKACLISRQSCERAGTRFNVRGANDDGQVANFVETEQLVAFDDTMTSFIQTRGSVPLFWEQPGVQVGSHRLKMSRGFEASCAAFERHISSLKALYGYQLLVNLLGRQEGEAILSAAFKDHLNSSTHNFDTHMIAFDYHRYCSSGKLENISIMMNKAKPSIDNFQFFTIMKGDIKSSQIGTIRTNCLDCLDRTNAVQTVIGLKLLSEQLESIGLTDKQSSSKFYEALKGLWPLNGDHISRMYSGTGAMESGTKGTIASKLHDGAVSVKRTIKNNFFDGSKQEAIDILLLGNPFIGSIGEKARGLLGRSFIHSTPEVLRDLCLQHSEYTQTRNLRVSVGTYNVNGGKHFRSIAYKHQSLVDWLLDSHKLAPNGILDPNEPFDKPTDVFAIGFEELVDLNTSNILSTSSIQKKEWGTKLQQTISRDNPYVLVTAEQLVGVCLFIFVREQYAPFIRDVAVSTVKTGLKGKAGNKGAVAIRMLFHSTSICFVCAHIAAGQSNVSERNNNIIDVSKRLNFPMGYTLNSHDYIFWCGDFNYRINLPNEEVKELIKNEDWYKLKAYDQLLTQVAEEKVFQGFTEGEINFAPTYKYDLFSDDYDTSEKMRTPAWTDRILFHRRNFYDDIGAESEDELEKAHLGSDDFSHGHISYYGRAELKVSDHRPVIAVIDIEIEQSTANKLAMVHDQVLKAQGPTDSTVIIRLSTEDDLQAIDIVLDDVINMLDEIGRIVLVRMVNDEIHVTYRKGLHALHALKLNGNTIGNAILNIRLRSPDYMLEKQNDSLFSIPNDVGEEEDIFQARQRLMSIEYSENLKKLTPILNPEKLNQQESFLEDYDDEILMECDEEDINEDGYVDIDINDINDPGSSIHFQVAPKIPPRIPPRNDVSDLPKDVSKQPSVPGRPKVVPERPKSFSVRPDSQSKQNVASTSSDLPQEKKMDVGVSNPFNIQHLMHVDASNIDEFISKMAPELQRASSVSKSKVGVSKPNSQVDSSKSRMVDNKPPSRPSMPKRPKQADNQETRRPPPPQLPKQPPQRPQPAQPPSPQQFQLTPLPPQRPHPVQPSSKPPQESPPPPLRPRPAQPPSPQLSQQISPPLRHHPVQLSSKPPQEPPPPPQRLQPVQFSSKPPQEPPPPPLRPQAAQLPQQFKEPPPPPLRPQSSQEPPPPPLRPQLNQSDQPSQPRQPPKLPPRQDLESPDNRNPPLPPRRPSFRPTTTND